MFSGKGIALDPTIIRFIWGLYRVSVGFMFGSYRANIGFYIFRCYENPCMTLLYKKIGTCGHVSITMAHTELE